MGQKRSLALAKRVLEAEAGDALPWAMGFVRRFTKIITRGPMSGMDSMCDAVVRLIDEAASEPDAARRGRRLMLATAAALRVPGAIDASVNEYGRRVRARRRTLDRDPAYLELRTRVEAAVGPHPGRALLALAPLAAASDEPLDHPLVQNGRDVFDAGLAWRAFQRTRAREARARALMHAAEAVCEGPYKALLKTLWRVAHFGEQSEKTVLPPVDLGLLVDGLQEAYPTLVSPNAKFVRKAAAHRHWRYVPRHDAVELWNETRRHEIVGRRTVAVKTLARWTSRLLYVSTRLIERTREAALSDVLVDGGVLAALLGSFAKLGLDPEPRFDDGPVRDAMARAMGFVPLIHGGGPPSPA